MRRIGKQETSGPARARRAARAPSSRLPAGRPARSDPGPSQVTWWPRATAGRLPRVERGRLPSTAGGTATANHHISPTYEVAASTKLTDNHKTKIYRWRKQKTQPVPEHCWRHGFNKPPHFPMYEADKCETNDNHISSISLRGGRRTRSDRRSGGGTRGLHSCDTRTPGPGSPVVSVVGAMSPKVLNPRGPAVSGTGSGAA